MCDGTWSRSYGFTLLSYRLPFHQMNSNFVVGLSVTQSKDVVILPG